MLKKASLVFLVFLQAIGLVFYCALVGLIFWRGNQWFGPAHLYLGPTMVLILLVVSVLISGLLVLAYPAFLFWEKKQRLEAVKLVACTSAWLVFFIGLFIFSLIIF